MTAMMTATQIRAEAIRRKGQILHDRGAATWREWLTSTLPSMQNAIFAQRHIAMWEWFAALTPGVRPRSKVDIWPRGGGKSSTVEQACAYVGTRTPEPTRRFVLYVSGTQTKADVHLWAIATILEKAGVHPSVNKFGRVRGWSKTLLRADNGFNVMSFGLDAGMRGIKLDEYRPDMIIFDDIDDKHDTAETTRKKISTITNDVIPAGSADCAIVFIQNKIKSDGVAAKLIDGTADFLHNRLPAVVEKAVNDLEYEQRQREDGSTYYVITSGTATWEGQSLAVSEQQINDEGISAFLQESQHEVDEPDGGLFSAITFRHCAWDEVPWGEIVDIQAWCDPAITNKDSSDCNGIQVDARAENSTIYRLYSWEQRSSPLETLMRAILKVVEYDGSTVGVETDQGGDTWQSVYDQAWQTLTEGIISRVTGTIEKAILSDDFDSTAPNKPDFVQMLRQQFLAIVRHKWEKHTTTPRWMARGENTPLFTLRQPTFKQAKASQGFGSKAERWNKMLGWYEQGKIVHVFGTHNVLEKALKRLPIFKPYDLADAAYWGGEAMMIETTRSVSPGRIAKQSTWRRG